jgi:uncharacterized C2H2 Zn-finger protein
MTALILVSTATKAKDGKTYLKCPICQTLFARKYNLKIHYEFHYETEGKTKDYKCRQCSKAFKQGHQ